jgi:ArsR family transcriptional regulator
MNKFVKTIKALSDENRLRIIMMLNERSMCVCEINETLDIALSTISAHLKLLKNADLIYDKKDGRWITYYINKNNKILSDMINIINDNLKNDEIINQDKLKIFNISKENCSLKN